MSKFKSTVLVLSPSHKCSIDFKVRGRLSERNVTSLADGSLAVRVGNRRFRVTQVNAHAPVRMIVPAHVTLPGLS